MNASFFNFKQLFLISDLIPTIISNYLLLLVFFIQIALNILIIYFWRSASLKKFHNVYQAEQKIHDGFIPRFGGMVMVLVFLILSIFELIQSLWETSMSILLWCLLPLIFVTILEDVYNNINPKARLFFIFISAVFVFIFDTFDLPVIDIPLVSDLFINNSWLLVFFLIVALAAMVNAFNLIDGANGLLLLTFISILFCLKLMSINVGDVSWVEYLNLIILICFFQLIFNFPRALMFCGDLGAYTFGFIIALSVIIFFGQYSNFVTWQAVLILLYPSWELIFTMFRRYTNNKNPLEADRLHLHHYLYTYLNFYLKKKLFSNSLTTVFLFPVWGFALIWLAFHGPHLSLVLTFQGIGLNILIYIVLYFIFAKMVKKLDLS